MVKNHLSKSFIIVLFCIVMLSLCACSARSQVNHSVSSVQSSQQSGGHSADDSSVGKSDTSAESSSSENEMSSQAPLQSSYDSFASVNSDNQQETLPEFRNKYFVSRLSRQELHHFSLLYESACQCKEGAEFSEPVTEETLERLMWLLNYDCPELIHLSGDYVPHYSSTEPDLLTGVSFRYTMTQQEYENNLKELDNYFSDLQAKTSRMTDEKKELYVYDIMFNSIVFDEYSKHAGSVYGALIEHQARCEGISKAFTWCMQQCGVTCLTIAGTPLWENSGVYSSHSWNIIQLNGSYYHVDLAADNLPSKDAKPMPPLYGFLNVDDDTIAKTHLIHSVFSDLGVPECKRTDLNYHVQRKLLITNDNDPKEQFFQILDRNYHEGQDNTLSIRFVTDKLYQEFISSEADWFADYQEQHQLSAGEDSLYYNDTALTVVFIIHSLPSD